MMMMMMMIFVVIITYYITSSSTLRRCTTRFFSRARALWDRIARRGRFMLARRCASINATRAWTSARALSSSSSSTASTSSSTTSYETVVGVEIHTRLATRSKLFSGAPSTYGAPPNTCVAAFDAAHPGTLPVLNATAVALAIKLALALEGRVQSRSSFDRKHYFYADLPHGYQITQQRAPISLGGRVRIGYDGSGDASSAKYVGIERLQIEMDTGKSSRASSSSADVGDGTHATHVDLNRAGQALVEIVSAPDMRSGEDASAMVEAMQRILRYLNVSDANMEEGSLRCDVNVSVRTSEDAKRGKFGERVEIKNLNSLRSIVRAVKYEAKRHVEVLSAGGVVERQTRTFDTNTGKTVVLRSKESLLDYRFTPEPDLPPLVLTTADVEAISNRMPELPAAAFDRLTTTLGVSVSAATTILAFPTSLKYFDTAMGNCGDAKGVDVANFIANEIIGAARKDGGATFKDPLSRVPRAASAMRVGQLLSRVARGDISGRMAKQVLEALMNSDERSLSEIIDDVCGGGQMSSDGGADDALRAICAAVVSEMTQEVKLFRSGKTKLMGALVGEVMKRTSGRANPKEASALLAECIHADGD